MAQEQTGLGGDAQASATFNRWAIALTTLFILAFTTVAYAPVLFNFFCGDDFVHLTWLSQAVKNHELIWRNFHSSWLDGTTTKFYRPLISIFMVTDYLTWGLNGLGFHITNLVFHLVSTAALFLVSLRLSRYFSPIQKENRMFAIFAALIFGLYPLHTEAVSWITGRVDAIVTAFFLCSLWCYMQWRDRTSSILWFLSSLVFMALGLLSKEMAIVLPATFFSYELFLHSRDRPGFQQIWRAFRPTVLFWVLLAGYFALRRIALGTFVGGYDDSLFFISNLREFAYSWLHGLKMLLIPLNKELLNAHHPLTKMWEVSIIFVAISSLMHILSSKRVFWVATFVASWLFFSLAPVYKIFAIADDLQGSRLACLATVPLCILIALGFTASLMTPPVPEMVRRLDRVRSVYGALFSVLCGIVLWTNNQAWAEAGRESNAIQRSLESLYSQFPGDPQVLFVSLPDQRKGAYICRNALWGMTKVPQLSRDISNCIMVDKFEPILPFGYFKNSLLESHDKVKVFRWDRAGERFQDIDLSSEQASTALNKTEWKGSELKNVLFVEDKGGIEHYGFLPDNSFQITTNTTRARRPAVKLNLELPCFSTDFVALTMKEFEPLTDSIGFDLLYKNAINMDFNLHHRAHGDVLMRDGQTTIIFALRNAPEWILGSKGTGFEIYLPRACKVAITGVKVLKAEELMPSLSFENSGFLGSKGFMHFDRKQTSHQVILNASGIDKATDVVFEITRPNLLFASQNTAEPSRVIMKELRLGATSGTITLERALFPALGIYEARAFAVDRAGNRAGVAGDHIVLAIDE